MPELINLFKPGAERDPGVRLRYAVGLGVGTFTAAGALELLRRAAPDFDATAAMHFLRTAGAGALVAVRGHAPGAGPLRAVQARLGDAGAVDEVVALRLAGTTGLFEAWTGRLDRAFDDEVDAAMTIDVVRDFGPPRLKWTAVPLLVRARARSSRPSR